MPVPPPLVVSASDLKAEPGPWQALPTLSKSSDVQTGQANTHTESERTWISRFIYLAPGGHTLARRERLSFPTTSSERNLG